MMLRSSPLASSVCVTENRQSHQEVTVWPLALLEADTAFRKSDVDYGRSTEMLHASPTSSRPIDVGLTQLLRLKK